MTKQITPQSIKKMFFKYVSLNILGMIGLSCYILADTFFVAQGVGADGLTALNLAIPIYSFLHGIGLMIGIGGATRFILSKSSSAFTQAVYYGGAAAVIFVIIGFFFSNSLTTALGADADTFQNTLTYLRVILCFSPFFLLNDILLCFVRNDGNPRLSMVAMLVGSLSNILLDYIFIFHFDMGMFGAAFATGLAPIISLSILSTHFIKKQNSFSFKIESVKIKLFSDISSLGASALITELSSGIVIIIFNIIILKLAGNTGVAAYGVIANIALVVIAMFTGVSQGVQPIVSQCHAEGKSGDLRKVVKYGIITSIAIAVLVYIVTIIFKNPIISLFNKNGDLQLAEIAKSGLLIYFTAFIFTGFNILSATFFSAIDKPRNGFIISVLRGFAIIIPSAFILSALLGLTGVWLTMPFTELIVFLISVALLAKTLKALKPAL